MNAQAVPVSTVLVDRLRPLLAKEGFSESEIVRRAEDMLAKAGPLIDGCLHQQDLEARIGTRYDADDPVMDVRCALKWLPAFQFAPFLFEAFSFVQACADVVGCYHRARPAMRYWDFWARDQPVHAVDDVLERFMQREFGVCDHAFALYAHRLNGLSEEFQARLYASFLKSGTILPVLSAIPFDALHPSCVDLAADIVELSDDTIMTDDVYPVTHVSYYAGMCAGLEEGFDSTMGDMNSEWYGHYATVCVDDVPVARMKMVGDHSVIGLLSVFTRDHRLACVRGGVYATSQEVVDKGVFEYDAFGPGAEISVDALPLFPIRMIASSYGFKSTLCFVNDMD